MGSNFHYPKSRTILPGFQNWHKQEDDLNGAPSRCLVLPYSFFSGFFATLNHKRQPGAIGPRPGTFGMRPQMTVPANVPLLARVVVGIPPTSVVRETVFEVFVPA